MYICLKKKGSLLKKNQQVKTLQENESARFVLTTSDFAMQHLIHSASLTVDDLGSKQILTLPMVTNLEQLSYLS